MHHNLDSDDICGTSNIYRITRTDFSLHKSESAEMAESSRCTNSEACTMDAEERKKELMAQNKVSDGMMFKMDLTQES